MQENKRPRKDRMIDARNVKAQMTLKLGGQIGDRVVKKIEKVGTDSIRLSYDDVDANKQVRRRSLIVGANKKLETT